MKKIINSPFLSYIPNILDFKRNFIGLFLLVLNKLKYRKAISYCSALVVFLSLSFLMKAQNCTLTYSNIVHESCYGSNNGQVTCNINNSQKTPYKYSCNGGPEYSSNNNSYTFSNLGAGTCTLKCTDGGNNIATCTVSITQPPQIGIKLTCSKFACNSNQCDVTCNFSNGNSPYIYCWNGGQTSQCNGNSVTCNNFNGGNYTCKVTDHNGCVTTCSIVITTPAKLTATISSQTNDKCYGDCNGSATVSAGGGTTPYKYSWSDGKTTSCITGLCAGNYTVTVTDDNGCTATATLSITQPAKVNVTFSCTPISCNGNKCDITCNFNNGNNPYVYCWNGGQTSQCNGNSVTCNDFVAGNWNCKVSDHNGCVSTGSICVTQPPPLTANITSQTNDKCFGDCNGSATVTGEGGTKPYKYLWSNGKTTSCITGLCAGTYKVTITDGRGCCATATVCITQPPKLCATICVTNVTCYGYCNGRATVTANGGKEKYTYKWSNKETTACVAGLCAGDYTVTVTDCNGCTATASARVCQPTKLIAAITSYTDVTCGGCSDGGATVTASGGTPICRTQSYKYLWNSGQTTSVVTGLTAGTAGTTYTVTVTDKNDCTATATVTITEPNMQLTISVSSTGVLCNGGSSGTATAMASSGTSPYTYLWSDASGQTNAVATGLTAGNYTVTVTDATDLSATASIAVTQPANALSVNAIGTNVSCNGGNNGTATATAAGGTAPYAYSWSSGATSSTATGLTAGTGGTTYTVTVTDNNACLATATVSIDEPTQVTATTSVISNVNCNGSSTGSVNVTAGGGTAPYSYSWSNGTKTSINSGLTAGTGGTTYTVTVTDNHGCIATATALISEPAKVTATASVISNVNCNGKSTGSIQVTAGGGNSPYTYLWSNSAVTSVNSGLTAGTGGTTYTVTVTDNNGCTATATSSISESKPLSVSASAISPSCSGGSNGTATASASGGVSPFTYNWSGGNAAGQIAATATGLSAGTYTVNVFDSYDCDNASATVTVNQPSAVTAVASANNNVSCNGGSNGSVQVTAGGGTSPYTYLWSNNKATSSISGLTAGTNGTIYNVTVTDNHGCPATASVSISEPTAVTATPSVISNVSCGGGTNGSVQVTAGGGTSPYTYLWSNGKVTSVISGLTTGTPSTVYTVTVTDNHGCPAIATVSISQPTVITIGFNPVVNVICQNGNTGTATAQPSGGAPPYTYDWIRSASNQTSPEATGLAAGTYTVQVTDGNNCVQTATVALTQPTDTIQTQQVNVTCNESNGTSQIHYIEGLVAPYTYLWSNGQTGTEATGLSGGNYTITVTGSNGCSVASPFQVNPFPLGITENPTQIATPTCSGVNSAGGEATVAVSGGESPYQYTWESSDINYFNTNKTATGMSANTYTVTIEDASDCSLTATVSITCSGSLAGPGPKDNGGRGNENTINGGITSTDMDVTIYPNPNRGTFTLTGLPKDANIVLYNTLGQAVNSFKGEKKTTLEINISDQPEGVYLLWIMNADGTQQKVSRVYKQ